MSFAAIFSMCPLALLRDQPHGSRTARFPVQPNANACPRCASIVHLHPLQPQLALRNVNLAHQLRVRLGHIVEREHAVAEFGEEESAEGDEEPEWELEAPLSVPEGRRCLGGRTTGIMSDWIFEGRGIRFVRAAM